MTPQVTYNGGKIMRMGVQNGLNITALDTLLFMPLPLDALPAAFDVPDAKGKKHFYLKQFFIMQFSMLFTPSMLELFNTLSLVHLQYT